MTKTIDIFCSKCGTHHHLADNGWLSVLCLNCKTEITYPKWAVEQPFQADANLVCEKHSPERVEHSPIISMRLPHR